MAFERVAGRRALPAYRLDLPFRPSPARPPAPRTGPLRLVQFGYIGPNRRLLEALEVLGALRDEVDFTLDVMGRVWDARAVAARAEALGIAGRVTVHGFVAEPALDAALRSADLVLNLRYPTMGEASGSQLRIWNAGAASVVTDAGWYAELAEDTVFKVGAETEAADLAALLRRLAADRTLGAARGQAGRARLEARHGPARYAGNIARIAAASPADTRAATLARAVLPARGSDTARAAHAFARALRG